MPGAVLHSGAAALCPHGGSLTIIAASPRVTVSGMPAATIADQGIVAGCVFTVPGPKPQPCVTTRWIAGTTRVLASGQQLLINPMAALCLSAEQIPAGSPSFVSGQTRVVAT